VVGSSPARPGSGVGREFTRPTRVWGPYGQIMGVSVGLDEDRLIQYVDQLRKIANDALSHGVLVSYC